MLFVWCKVSFDEKRSHGGAFVLFSAEIEVTDEYFKCRTLDAWIR